MAVRCHILSAPQGAWDRPCSPPFSARLFPLQTRLPGEQTQGCGVVRDRHSGTGAVCSEISFFFGLFFWDEKAGAVWVDFISRDVLEADSMTDG